jgi:hypothetical protein
MICHENSIFFDGIKQVQFTIQIKTSGIKYNKTLYFLVWDRNLLVLLNIQAIIAWSAMKTLFFFFFGIKTRWTYNTNYEEGCM